MIRKLDIHPAFGFETSERWEVAVRQRDAYLLAKGKDLGNYQYRNSKNKIIVYNIIKIVAYITALNFIIGIIRIAANIFGKIGTSDPEKNAICNRHICRGICDIFFGPLLVLVDIIQTLRDQITVDEYKFISQQQV